MLCCQDLDTLGPRRCQRTLWEKGGTFFASCRASEKSRTLSLISRQHFLLLYDNSLNRSNSPTTPQKHRVAIANAVLPMPELWIYLSTAHGSMPICVSANETGCGRTTLQRGLWRGEGSFASAVIHRILCSKRRGAKVGGSFDR